MPKKTESIPLHTMPDEFGLGIAIARATIVDLEHLAEINQVHRDAYHVFFLQETGTSHIHVDFQEYTLVPSSVGYIQPLQVHRIIKLDDVSFFALMISSESLNPEYVTLLQGIAPAMPLPLPEEVFALLTEAASLCVKLFDRRDDKMYASLLKNSCNTLVGLIVSQYLGQAEATGSLPRFDSITNAFKSALERNFSTQKRPSYYAQTLNISTPYLNECVKSVTGFSVSQHIQQRVILEAKRLLSHSGRSVKEIANDLGYDDYPYFSRMFTKVAGMTAVTFRNKNLD